MFAFQLQFQVFLHKEDNWKVIFFLKESRVLLVLGLTASKRKQNITESWNSQEICQPYDAAPWLHSRIQLASPGFTRPKSLPPEWAWLSRRATGIHTASCQSLLLPSLAYGKCQRTQTTKSGKRNKQRIKMTFTCPINIPWQ